MEIGIDIKGKEYRVILERGCIQRANSLLDTGRRCLIVTDDGVPEEYISTVSSGCGHPVTVTVPQGEGSKDLRQLEKLLTVMLREGFTRGDCVIAVGGGMAGDLAGFAAATYMRGIDFYNIPTTLLSQADSSIGGKTAVNLDGAKNIAGAFWQPRMVLIDPDLTKTLPRDQFLSGLAEIIKAGMIADARLFEYIEEVCNEAENRDDILQKLDVERLLEAALMVKKAVVEEDERESGRRRILNFGHTIGHGIESVTGMLHGWCVAAGMIPMCSPEVRERLVRVLDALGLPVTIDCDPEAVLQAMLHDKKMDKGSIRVVCVEEIGSASVKPMTPEELRGRMQILI
ncbi:MAG: 3-dehydroquinate synthase [Mogibacterium sp.]|nr:3-dehydroquinate synthase [Mogibacterium sp.]